MCYALPWLGFGFCFSFLEQFCPFVRKSCGFVVVCNSRNCVRELIKVSFSPVFY